ncbi:MAG: hypothetical protein QM690_08505 [Sphingobium sp.]
MISIRYDEEDGIVRTVASGLASVEEFNAYMPKALELMERSRARHGRALHLIDAADNPVQTRDTFDHIVRASEGATREGDRFAVVLHSALARLQINRMADAHLHRFFADSDSARGWLLDGAGTAAEAAR